MATREIKKLVVQQVVNRIGWGPQTDVNILHHVASHRDDDWEALARRLGLSGVLCRLRWYVLHAAALKAGNVTAGQSWEWTAWEKEVLQRAGIIFALGGWSTKEMCQVLSQWLPRTSSSIKHKFNTDIAKSLPKVAAGSVTEIDVEKLATAIDALQSQLMMWTATTQGLPSELKAQLKDHQMLAAYITRNYITRAALFEAVDEAIKKKNTKGAQAAIPAELRDMPSAAASCRRSAAQAATTAAAAISSHLLNLPLVAGQAAFSSGGSGCSTPVALGSPVAGVTTAANVIGSYLQHGLPVSRPLTVLLPAAPSTPQASAGVHPQLQRVLSGSSSSGGGVYLRSGSSTPDSGRSVTTGFNGCQLQPSASISPVVWHQQQQQQQVQQVLAATAATWQQSFLPAGVFAGGVTRLAAAAGGGGSPLAAATAPAGCNRMHSAAVAVSAGQLQQQLQQNPFTAAAAGRPQTRFSPARSLAAAGGGGLPASLPAPAAAAAGAAAVTRKRNAAAVVPGPVDTAGPVELAAKKRCIQVAPSAEAAAATNNAIEAVQMLIQQQQRQRQQQQKLVVKIVDSQEAAAAAVTDGSYCQQPGSCTPIAAAAPVAASTPVIAIDDDSDEEMMPGSNGLNQEARAAADVAPGCWEQHGLSPLLQQQQQLFYHRQQQTPAQAAEVQQQQHCSASPAAPYKQQQQHCSPIAAALFCQQQQQYAGDNPAAAAVDREYVLDILDQHPTDEDQMLMSDIIRINHSWNVLSDQDCKDLGEWLDV